MRQDKKLVSVIVPVYNVEPYLEECVNSIRQQSYSNLEIILVDDGSPDRCGEMCDAFAAKDSRIKVIHKENGGLGYARNSGLDAATGCYVSFIDSDDWIGPDRIRTMVDAAEHNAAQIVVGGLCKVYPSGRKETDAFCTEPQLFRGKAEVMERLFYPCIGKDAEDRPNSGYLGMSVWRTLYHRSIIEENNIRFVSEREIFSEDMFFNLEYRLHIDCGIIIQDTTYYYRYNPNSLSNLYREDRLCRIRAMFEQLNSILSENNLQAGAGFRVEREYMLYMRHELMLISGSGIPDSKKLALYQEVLHHPLTEAVCSRYPSSGIPRREQIMVRLMKTKRTRILKWYLELQILLIRIRDSR